MKRLLFLIQVLIFCLAVNFGQDSYLAHYSDAPQYLNPALTGMYFGKSYNFRLNANYASQSIGTFNNMYHTAAFGYDFRLKKFGFGAFVINNQAGASNYNVANILFSAAYEISIDKTYRHNLTTGIQVGIFHHSFNQDKLLFESQYTADGFDPGLSNNEDFQSNSIMKIDGGLGGFYSFRDRQVSLNPFAGIAVFHATNPNISFYKTEDKSYYPFRFSLYAGTGWNINEGFQLSPRALVTRQGTETFVDAGLLTFYSLGNPVYELLTGIQVNTNDIITLSGGLRIRGNTFRVSYGFNSFLQKSLNATRNDVEFSVVLQKQNKSSASFYN